MPSGKTKFNKHHDSLLTTLQTADPQVYELIEKERRRLRSTVQLVAAENYCSPAVLAALGSVLQNKTAEGFPGARMHGGCEVVDEAEELAAARAKETFGAQYANVQPHSGTQANQIVLTALLETGDRILSFDTAQGGHYSHGSHFSFTGRFFSVENYYVDKKTFLLDYDDIREKALKAKPKLIICGASAYARTIDFKKFREIADEVGAYLLADISHISGLVIAGAHPSPVDYAHFTTTSTYKPGGPRGGLILMGGDFNRKIKTRGKEKLLSKLIEDATFPGMQGTPYFNHIAAKAVFFKETLSDEYRARQFRIIENAKSLAADLLDAGYDVLTGGTNNHMIMINVANLREGLTGAVAQKCLEDCGIITDKILLPYDDKPPAVTSGIRLGTPIVTKQGMGPKEMKRLCVLINDVLKKVETINDSEYRIEESFKSKIKSKVMELCSEFTIV